MGEADRSRLRAGDATCKSGDAVKRSDWGVLSENFGFESRGDGSGSTFPTGSSGVDGLGAGRALLVEKLILLSSSLLSP